MQIWFLRLTDVIYCKLHRTHFLLVADDVPIVTIYLSRLSKLYPCGTPRRLKQTIKIIYS